MNPAGSDHAVGARAPLPRIGEERDGEAVTVGEALVGLDGLGGDTQHRHAERLEPVPVVPIGAELPGADRREVPWIEGEDHAVPPVVEGGGSPQRGAGALELELRCHLTDAEPRHQPPRIVTRRMTTGARGLPLAEPSCSIRCTTSNPSSPGPQRVVGRQTRVRHGHDEELAPRPPGGSTGLLAIATIPRVYERLRRALIDEVSGSAGAASRRIAALDHEPRHDPVKEGAIVDALASEIRERRGRLRGPRVSREILKPPQLVSTVAVGGPWSVRVGATGAPASPPAQRPRYSRRVGRRWSLRSAPAAPPQQDERQRGRERCPPHAQGAEAYSRRLR